MKRSVKSPPGCGWLMIPMALAYGAVMLHLGGNFPHPANGAVSYHLLQSQALLEGHFSLGNSLSQLRPELAWHNGRVQQIWGLGIALWLLPFQALWRLMGGQWFPDQLALGLAFALLALYAGHTGLRWVKQGRTMFGIGFIWLILSSPPLWTLARDSQLVFEETVLYGLLLSLGILTAVARVAFFNSRRDFWLCCVLCGLSGLVRPTLAMYGVCGVCAVCGLEYIRGRSLKSLLPGIGILLSGLSALAITNQQRFGSPFEFGHRLTVSSESMIYITRFGNPYQQTGDMHAAKELFELLFLSPPIRNSTAFAGDLFPGQAPETRWRRLNFTTFDPGYPVIMALAIFIFLRRLTGRIQWAQPEGCLVLGLSIWSGISFAALFAFYLHYPSISSRYLLDFLPALIGFALLAWWQASTWWRGLGILILAVWLVHGIAACQVAAKVAEPPPSGITPPPALALHSLAGAYTIASNPSQTGIPLNGAGWDAESGIADNMVILMMDQPRFVELHVSERRTLDGSPPQADFYRAMINGQMLHLKKAERETDGFKVVFDVPDTVQNQDQILFLCFSKGYEQADRDSERFLYSVRWK